MVDNSTSSRPPKTISRCRSLEDVCRKVIRLHHPDLKNLCDSFHVFTNRITDSLYSNACIQLDQKHKIESEQLPHERLKVLLDIVSSEGRPAFDKLCNALELFGTEEKTNMAELLRTSMEEQLKLDYSKCKLA